MFEIKNLEELLQQLIESGNNTIETDNEIISFEVDDNSFTINYRIKQPKKSDLFKKWVQTIDDELFLETCELYTQKFGSMEDLAKKVDEQDELAMKNFRDTFTHLVEEKIERLSKYLL